MESVLKGNEESTQQTFVLMKTSSRRLDQDEYIRCSYTSLETFSRRLEEVLIKTKHSSWPYAFNAPSNRFEDVLQKRLQYIFKTSRKDVFKKFSRRIIKLNCLC